MFHQEDGWTATRSMQVMIYRMLCLCVCICACLFVVVCVFCIRDRWRSAGGEQIIGFRSKGGQGEYFSTCCSLCAAPSSPWIIHYPCFIAALCLDRMVLSAFHARVHKMTLLCPVWMVPEHKLLVFSFLQSPTKTHRQYCRCSCWIWYSLRFKSVSRERIDLSFSSSLKRDYKATEMS